MAQIYVPAESDYALALREPNLLLPGRKPVGHVDIKHIGQLSPARFLPFWQWPNQLGVYGQVSTIGSPDFTYNGYLSDKTGDSVALTLPAFGASPVTIAVKCTVRAALTSNYAIFGRGDTLSTEFMLRLGTASSRWGLYANGGSCIIDNDEVNIYEDQSVLWVLVLDGSSAHLYRDTKYVGSDTYTSFSTTKDLQIGGADGGRWFGGEIEYFGVWLSAFTAAQVKQIPSFAYLKPANDTPYLFSVGGGALTPPTLGTVTGVSLTPTTARITVPVSFD